jgi:hypothetical protein
MRQLLVFASSFQGLPSVDRKGAYIFLPRHQRISRLQLNQKALAFDVSEIQKIDSGAEKN